LSLVYKSRSDWQLNIFHLPCFLKEKKNIQK
jgi:hypothetical protein